MLSWQRFDLGTVTGYGNGNRKNMKLELGKSESRR
jgi:hypothetical protein